MSGNYLRALFLVCGLWLVPVYANNDFNNVDLTDAVCCKNLALPDSKGTPRQLTEFKGKVVAVVFGFTSCPDVCPTTLYELSQSMKQLGEQSKDVQVIFVTLDPSRDTNKVLSQYVSAFHPTFIALRGSIRETVSAVHHFRVFFKKIPGKTAQTYSIDHSVGVYLFDRTGKPRIYARSAEAKTLIPDLKRLLSEKVPG